MQCGRKRGKLEIATAWRLTWASTSPFFVFIGFLFLAMYVYEWSTLNFIMSYIVGRQTCSKVNYDGTCLSRVSRADEETPNIRRNTRTGELNHPTRFYLHIYRPWVTDFDLTDVDIPDVTCRLLTYRLLLFNFHLPNLTWRLWFSDFDLPTLPRPCTDGCSAIRHGKGAVPADEARAPPAVVRHLSQR